MPPVYYFDKSPVNLVEGASAPSFMVGLELIIPLHPYPELNFNIVVIFIASVILLITIISGVRRAPNW